MICEELSKSDVIRIVKDDKDIERKFRKIVADIVTDMFRVLWQHNSIFKTLGNA